MLESNMFTRLKIFILAIVFTGSVKGQVYDYGIRQQVLEKNEVDSLFVFGKWSASGKTETHLTYLGEVTTKNGRVLKVMKSCWFWGPSHRATSRILIYNGKNQYLGNYALGMTYDLPDKLENGYLVFTNLNNPNCDKNVMTKVNFIRGLPNEIFIRCSGKNGNIYIFESE
jgi:hypothetical protein